MEHIYDAVGINRPKIKPGDLTSRAAAWRRTKRQLGTANDEINEAVEAVSKRNEGEALTAFGGWMNGSEGPGSAIVIMRDDAQEFADAHDEAADALRDALTLMDGEAAVADGKLRSNKVLPFVSPLSDFIRRRMIISGAREAMQGHMDDGAAKVTDAYDFEVTQLAIGQLQQSKGTADRGLLNPEVEEMWDGLSKEEKQAILKQMIIDYAAERGVVIHPEDISFPEELDSNGYAYPDGTIEIHDGYSTTPQSMHTATHEAQHIVQLKAEEEYDSYSDEEIEEFRNAGVNPFEEYGMTIDEVEAISDEDYIDYEDDEEGYYATPSEVNARKGGREGASIDPGDFKETARRAGVEVDG